MSLIDEMLLHVQLGERERWLAHRRLTRGADDRPGASPRAGSDPAAGRLLRILDELYGPAARPDHDPALFGRLAWTGADD